MIDVFYLGSCRLLEPLQILHEQNEINLINNKKNFIGFTHYINEHIQLLDFLINRNIPNNILKYMYHSYNSKNIYGRSCIDNIDNIINYYIPFINKNTIFILEISTLKQITYKNYNLNLEHIKNVKNNLNYELLKISYDELERKILLLKEKFPKIIIVSHIYNKNILSRNELINELLKICKNNNITFINPIEFIENNDLRDQNHYNNNGFNKMSKIYYKYIYTL